MSENIKEVPTKAKLNFIKGRKLHEYVFDLTNPADIRKYNQALKLDDDKRNTYLLLLSREQLKDRNPNSTYITQMKLIEEQPNQALSELKRSEKKSELENKKERLEYLSRKVDLTDEEEEEFKRLPKEIEKLETDIRELKEGDENTNDTTNIPNSKTLVSTFNKINKKLGNALTREDLTKILTSKEIIPALTEAVRRGNKLRNLDREGMTSIERLIADYEDEMKKEEKTSALFIHKSNIHLRDDNDWVACFNLFQLLSDEYKLKILQEMDFNTSNITVFKRSFFNIIANTQNFQIFISAIGKIKELAWYAEELRENYATYETYNLEIDKFIATGKLNASSKIQKILKPFFNEDIVVKMAATSKKSGTTPNIRLKVIGEDDDWYCGLVSAGTIDDTTKEKFDTLIEKTSTAFDDFNLEAQTASRSGVPLLVGGSRNTYYIQGTLKNITQIFIMLCYWDNGKLRFNKSINTDLIYDTPFTIQKLPPTMAAAPPIEKPIEIKEEPLEPLIEETKKEMKELEAPKEMKEEKKKKKKGKKEKKEVKEMKEEKEIPEDIDLVIEEEKKEEEEETEEEDDKMMGKGISENDYQHIKTELQTIKSLLFTVIYKMNKKDRDKYNKKNNNKSGSFDWLFN